MGQSSYIRMVNESVENVAKCMSFGKAITD
jgi:hypothetical protein